MFECDKKTGEGCSAEYKRLLREDKPLEGAGAADPLLFVGGLEVRGARFAAKAINLPAWRRVAIDMVHIASGHMKGGPRVSAAKDLFPESMSAAQVERAVRQAYRFAGDRLATQGDRVLVQGQGGGLTIRMWVNRATKTIETAYPVY